MSKAYGRGNAAFFCTSDTERTLHKERSQRRARAGGTQLIDAVIKGERVKLVQNPKPREKAIEIQIRVALAAAGVLCWKHNVDYRAAFGKGLGRGVADLICVVPPLGRFLAIEVKRPSTRTRTSDAQKRWIAVVQRFGGVAGVATCVEEAMVLAEQARGMP